jgi:hypothetical protein
MVTTEGSKKPLSPNDLRGTEWGDPSCWGTFSAAVSAVRFGYAEHIGLVLRKENGIVAIDLDNKPSNPATSQQLEYHSDVLAGFGQSYTERSVSNTEDNPCYHIFVRGTIPRSVNKEHIELRCDNFIVVTGDVDGDDPKPILNGHEITSRLAGLARFLGAEDTALAIVDDSPRRFSTDHIVEKMLESKGADYLKAPIGKSETDYTIFAWIWESWTQNRVQALEVFDSFPYSQRKKSDGTPLTAYHKNLALEKAIQLVESKKVPVDIAMLMKPKMLSAPVETKKSNPMAIEKMPDGWCKEFARFTLANSKSPLEEAAVFASFLPVCGIGGRVFSASGTGLNQMFTLLALTGTGKDEAVNAAQRVLTRVAMAGELGAGVAIQAFVADDFASAQGIHRALAAQPVMFGYNKESGMWMERMAKSNPDEHMLMINSVMLDIYNLHDAYLKGRKYAKKDNDLDAVYSPTLSTLSVSTPRQFYDYMSIKMLDTGITGRELIFECEDTQAKSRPYSYVAPEPPYYVVEAVIRLAVEARKNIADVQYRSKPVLATSDGETAMNWWEIEYLRLQNMDNGDIHRAIWSRANLKMRKLAATLAVSYAMMFDVGDGMRAPIITLEHVDYAVAVVNYCSQQLQDKLNRRGIGNLYIQQEQIFDEAVDWYFSPEANLFTNVRNPEIRAKMYRAREDGVIFKSAIMTRCAGNGAFSGYGRSTANELERTLKSKLGSGLYQSITTDEVYKRYGTRAEAFGRVDT